MPLPGTGRLLHVHVQVIDLATRIARGLIDAIPGTGTSREVSAPASSFATKPYFRDELQRQR